MKEKIISENVFLLSLDCYSDEAWVIETGGRGRQGRRSSDYWKTSCSILPDGEKYWNSADGTLRHFLALDKS